MGWLEAILSLFTRAKPAKEPVPKPPPYFPPTTDLLARINACRAGYLQHPLWESHPADLAAKIQSDWQAKRDQIGHDGPPGFPSVVDRLKAQGIKGVVSGEIAAEGEIAYWPDGRVAINYDFDTAIRYWLTSPGHKAILLDPQWTHAGAAMATAPSGKIYSTAVFYAEN